jgi:transcriptional regulator of nitric oxide reductase
MNRSAPSLRSALVVLVAAASLAAGDALARDLKAAAKFFSSASTTVEQPSGQPPSARITGRDGEVVGYTFSTWDVAGSVGYSGRPLDIIAAVTPEGVIAGAEIVAHEEPILVIGISNEALAAYVASLKGLDVRAAAGLRRTQGFGRTPQAIAGATVSSAVIRDALVRAARAVLQARAGPADKPRLDRASAQLSSWPQLVAEGALRPLSVARGEAARLTGASDAEPDKSFIELWLALATPPAIGESLVGKREYESLVADFPAEDDFLLIAANGLYSLFIQRHRVAPHRRVRAHRDRAGRHDRAAARRGSSPDRHAARGGCSGVSRDRPVSHPARNRF